MCKLLVLVFIGLVLIAINLAFTIRVEWILSSKVAELNRRNWAVNQENTELRGKIIKMTYAQKNRKKDNNV